MAAMAKLSRLGSARRRPRTNPGVRSARPIRAEPGTGSSPQEQFTLGRQDGYERGFDAGYREGVRNGQQSFGNWFEGTSIIIPTYNQKDLLMQCVDSIRLHTGVPYEIIIVDNGSTDGTGDYLQSLTGQVRFRVLETNRGFAGAVNVGLMMSRGTTLLLLNNDTLVAERWLDNMLACLNSDDQIGMVGPVTNFIGGDQLIDVPYTDVKDMPAFAREFNRPDPGKWRRTDRLTGFCLLFRRDLFDRIGFFDEGYELGNYEDDDYNIRVRLLGSQMAIAGDSFIHHFGSVSIKSFGDEFRAINDRNQIYFMGKWQNPYEWIQRVRQHSAAGGALPGMHAFFPDRVAVQGWGADVFWIEGGMRRPVEGALGIPSVRLSKVDLRRWPLAAPISALEAERRWRGIDDGGTGAGVALLPDGTPYHLEGNTVRRIISSTAMQAWQLHLKPLVTMAPEQLADKAEGLPIVAPPQIRQRL